MSDNFNLSSPGWSDVASPGLSSAPPVDLLFAMMKNQANVQLEQQLEQGRVIAAETGNQAGVGTACSNLGNFYRAQGQYEKAIGLFEQSRTMFEKVVDRVGMVEACNNLGICYENLGQYAEAIARYMQGRVILEELGDRAGVGAACTKIGNVYQKLGQYDTAITLHEHAKVIAEEVCNKTSMGKACSILAGCYQAQGQYDTAIALLEQGRAIDEEVGDRGGVGQACGDLGVCFQELGQYVTAIDLYEQGRAIAEEIGDRAGAGDTCNNIGTCYIGLEQYDKAIGVLEQGRLIYEEVERDVGAQDDWRVAVFEQQQRIYQQLQAALLAHGQMRWALGVAAQAKARALSHCLDSNPSNLSAGGYSNSQQRHQRQPPALRLLGFASRRCDKARALAKSSQSSSSRSYQDVYREWWKEMQGMACAEGSSTCIVEFSFLSRKKLAVWVLSGTGDLLCSKTLLSAGLGETKDRTIQQLLAEARTSMRVRGRDAMVSSAAEHGDEAHVTPSDTRQDNTSGERGIKCKKCSLKFAQCACAKVEAIAALAKQSSLLREIYRALLQPIEALLASDKELLIVPHRELFEVPWATLIDADGRYLIERHVIRVVPSLRVARQAAELQHSAHTSGHVLVVGNPWPNRVGPLKGAEEEANKVVLTLTEKEMKVRLLATADATKARVTSALQGARWAHFACHGDIDSDSLVLAIPAGTKDTADASLDLSMKEVQKGVKLGHGATVVLSACNTGRGDIKAEGVVGLSRGFLLAGAAATLVSLWAVSFCFSPLLPPLFFHPFCSHLRY